jgi:exodeoxyribonuclease VII large subunit
VPVKADLAAMLADLGHRQRQCAARPVSLGRERLEARVQRMPKLEALLQPKAQRLDEAGERLRRGLLDRAAAGRQRLGELRLTPSVLQRNLRDAERDLAALRLAPVLVERRIADSRERLAGTVRVMRSLDPDAVLARGYVRVTGADDRTLTDRADAAKEAVLTLKFRDGDLATVPAGSPASAPSAPSAAPARRPKRRTAAPPGQEDLFG